MFFLSKTFRMQRIILSTHTHSTCYKPRNNSHRKSMHVTRIAWHKQNDKSPKMEEEEEENKIIFLSVSMCFTTFSFSHLPCWMDMAVFFFSLFVYISRSDSLFFSFCKWKWTTTRKETHVCNHNYNFYVKQTPSSHIRNYHRHHRVLFFCIYACQFTPIV